MDDVDRFEADTLAARGLPRDSGIAHRMPHFQHLFAGDGYAAGYYVYLWAEVLEADAWQAFVEAGASPEAATPANASTTAPARKAVRIRKPAEGGEAPF